MAFGRKKTPPNGKTFTELVEQARREGAIQRYITGEMQAEGIVQRIDGQLVLRDGDRQFMVEVTVLDVTGA